MQDEQKAARATYAATHGFDNGLMSMKTIFIASGPSFKKGYRLQSSIKSVDIYPLLCHLLDLEPAPNNGSFQKIAPLLQGFPDKALITTPSLFITMLSVIFAWAI